MKALGAEIKKFWEEGFPKDYYHDDSAIEITNDSCDVILEPNQKYELEDCGYLAPNDIRLGNDKVISFEDAFKKWKKEQTTAIVVVEIPKEDIENIRQKIKEAGYKILE